MVGYDTHALFHAIACNDYETFSHLLDQEVVGLDIRDSAGITLLMRAIQMESVAMVRYLINHGANLYIPEFDGIS
ncbi:MAG: ankyrin repeat domain-containing protein [Campylobacterales bacterium]|nr:ankyrin repeat domain-containing protein [Campylobacterales bacterium]